MKTAKLNLQEIILTACLCAEHFQEVDADSPFKNGFSLPVYSHPLDDNRKRVVCHVIVANIDEAPGLWSVLVSDVGSICREASIISAAPYLDYLQGKKSQFLTQAEEKRLEHPYPDIYDRISLYIDYDEIPSSLSIQVLDGDGNWEETITSFDHCDLLKAIEYAKEHNACVVFVDERHENDEDDSNPIIWTGQ